MIEILKNVNVDWLSKRRILLTVSILLMLIGLASAVLREAVDGGTSAFNLGVDFREGTQVTAKFAQRPELEAIRAALSAQGAGEAVVQGVIDLDRNDEVIIKLPQQALPDEAQANTEATSPNAEANQASGESNQAGNPQLINVGRARVEQALQAFGQVGKLNEGAAVEIIQTDYVGPAAAPALRNQAIAVTLLALIGVLLYIAFRFEWTYGAAAVITVFHDVLVTLGLFSVFQFEVNLTVVVALITLVGFSVNDTIVTFDRVRENLRLNRRGSLYEITNGAINETLSRTIITGGLVFLSVLALVLFGGEVLRPFSLALFIGIIVGTYSTIAIASPIMVWWQQRLDALNVRAGSASAQQNVKATNTPRAGARAKATGKRPSQTAAR